MKTDLRIQLQGIGTQGALQTKDLQKGMLLCWNSSYGEYVVLDIKQVTKCYYELTEMNTKTKSIYTRKRKGTTLTGVACTKDGEIKFHEEIEVEESKKSIEDIGNMIMHPITKEIAQESNYEMFEDWKEVEFVELTNCKEELTDYKAILSGNMNGEEFTIEMSIEDYFKGKNFKMNNERVNEDNTKIKPFSKETLKYTNSIVNTIIEMDWTLLELKIENEYIHGLVKKSNGKTEWEGLYGGSNYDKEYKDTKEVYRCLKGRIVLSNTDDLKEDKELSTLVEETTQKESKEVDNNIKVTVNFNQYQNGIELSFTDKPSEEIRQQLNSNGFRWSRFKKIWWCKDSDDKREFLKDIGFLTNEGETVTITEADKKDIEYPEIDIDDIENYTIDKSLSNRENGSHWIFRNKDRDHNKEIQDYLLQCNNEIVELLEKTDNKEIEYKLKSFLQYYKKAYHKNCVKRLTNRANNPSIAVTGRCGRNINKYNKMMNAYDNLMREHLELLDKYKDKISSFESKIIREKQQELKKEMDNNLNSIKEIPKFKKSKIKIDGNAVDNILNIDGDSWIREVNAYQLEGYSVINNWGAWKVYNAEGKEIYSAKSKGTLKDAQKYVLWILKNKDQKEAI